MRLNVSKKRRAIRQVRAGQNVGLYSVDTIDFQVGKYVLFGAVDAIKGRCYTRPISEGRASIADGR